MTSGAPTSSSTANTVTGQLPRVVQPVAAPPSGRKSRMFGTFAPRIDGWARQSPLQDERGWPSGFRSGPDWLAIPKEDR